MFGLEYPKTIILNKAIILDGDVDIAFFDFSVTVFRQDFIFDLVSLHTPWHPNLVALIYDLLTDLLLIKLLLNELFDTEIHHFSLDVGQE